MAEAQQVSGYLKGIHHSRKISHLQVNYPETVEKLSKLQDMRAQTAHYSTKSILPRSASQEIVYQRKQFRLKDFEQTMNSHVKQEKFINFRKKEFNRETGRKAVANQVSIFDRNCNTTVSLLIASGRSFLELLLCPIPYFFHKVPPTSKFLPSWVH